MPYCTVDASSILWLTKAWMRHPPWLLVEVISLVLSLHCKYKYITVLPFQCSWKQALITKRLRSALAYVTKTTINMCKQTIKVSNTYLHYSNIISSYDNN